MPISITEPTPGVSTGWGDTLNTALNTLTSGVNNALLTPTAVYTTNQTAVAGYLTRMDSTAGNLVITLPAAAGETSLGGQKYDASGNTVTLTPAGTDTINGSTSPLVLRLGGETKTLVGLAAGGGWVTSGGVTSLASTDARYQVVNTAVVLSNGTTTGPKVYGGSGVPTIAGTAGDRYMRSDTPATAGQREYICTVTGAAGAATWVALAT